jgi:ribosomal protein L28
MARLCELTGRKTRAGKRRRHQRGSAGGATGGAWSKKAQATNRVFRPNLTTVRVLVDGKPQQMKLSMKAYKRIRKFGRLGNVTLPVAAIQAA